MPVAGGPQASCGCLAGAVRGLGHLLAAVVAAAVAAVAVVAHQATLAAPAVVAVAAVCAGWFLGGIRDIAGVSGAMRQRWRFVELVHEVAGVLERRIKVGRGLGATLRLAPASWHVLTAVACTSGGCFLHLEACTRQCRDDHELLVRATCKGRSYPASRRGCIQYTTTIATGTKAAQHPQHSHTRSERCLTACIRHSWPLHALHRKPEHRAAEPGLPRTCRVGRCGSGWQVGRGWCTCGRT